MAKPQPLFIVRVADRKTGNESELRIHAKDQDSAMAAAMEQGWLVVSVRGVPVTDDDGPNASVGGMPKASPDRLRHGLGRAASIYRLGILSTVIGTGFFIAALGYNTAPSGVHNIGLLNRATVFGLAGVAGIISGAALCAVGVVGGGIMRLIAGDQADA